MEYQNRAQTKGRAGNFLRERFKAARLYTPPPPPRVSGPPPPPFSGTIYPLENFIKILYRIGQGK